MLTSVVLLFYYRELRDVNVTSLPGTLFAGNPFLER